MKRRDALKALVTVATAGPIARFLPGCADVDSEAEGDATAVARAALSVNAPYMALLASDTTWGNGWTHVVAGKWSSSPYSGLLFYNQATGLAQFYDTSGAGRRISPPLSTYTNWRQSWSHVIPGYFGSSGFSGIFLYDPIEGFAAYYDTDGHGNISIGPIAQRYTRHTWTHVVPGMFTTSSFTSLLLYSQSEGYAELWDIDSNRNITVRATYSGWRTSWTHIVSGQFNGDGYSDLFFYEGSSGDGAFYQSQQGLFTALREFYGLFPVGATNLLAGNFGGGSGASDLLFQGMNGVPAGSLSFWAFYQDADTHNAVEFDGLHQEQSGLRPGVRAGTSALIAGNFFMADPDDGWFQDGPIRPRSGQSESERLDALRQWRAAAGGFVDLCAYDRAAGIGEIFLHEQEPADEDPLAGYASSKSSHDGGTPLSTGSVLPGEVVEFFVSSQVGAFTITVKTATGRVMGPVAVQSGTPAPLPIGRTAYRDGAKWPRAGALRIPASWPSGLYLAHVQAVNSPDTTLEIPFVVRSPNPGAANKILVVIPDTTFEAYNWWGGRSLYGFVRKAYDPVNLTGAVYTSPDAGYGEPYSFTVCFDRPYRKADNDSTIWQYRIVPLVHWLEHQRIGADYCTARDLDVAVPSSNYRLMVFPGHQEYWSKQMRTNVQAFADAGGGLAFFSGNTCYWQVRFDYSKNQMICYKSKWFDPLVDKSIALTTVHWNEPMLQMPPNKTTGVNGLQKVVEYKPGDTLRTFQLETAQVNHWAFRDASDLIDPNRNFGLYANGTRTVLEGEMDATDDASPSSFVHLATARDDSGVIASMGLFAPKQNGALCAFVAPTENWTLGLSQDSSTWTAVDQITHNVLTTLSGQQNVALGTSVASTSTYEGEGWGRQRAVDGKRGSIYNRSMGITSSAYSTPDNTEEILITFGSQRISKVVLYPRNDDGFVGAGFPVDFTIAVWGGSAGWLTRVARTGYPNPGGAAQVFTWGTADLTIQVRIRCTKLGLVPGYGYYSQFTEIELY